MPPFHESVRKEMFKQSDGTCQGGENCFCNRIYGRPATFRDGFTLHAAHHREMHQVQIDYDPSHGRMLDTQAHLIEEIKRGNHKGAQLLYEQHTFMNYKWLAQNGFKDRKAPLQFYYDWARCEQIGDGFGIEGLAAVYRDRFGIPEPQY